MRRHGIKKIYLILVAALFLSAFFIPRGKARAETMISGVISGDVHWTQEESPIIIDGSVGMERGSQLIIDPGVVVKFTSGSQLLEGNGTITAVGTAYQPIIFTSFVDDTGGDSNLDGGISKPASGDWERISLSNPTDQISHAEFRYGQGCLDLSGSLVISGVNVNHCGYGIFTRPGFIGTIENNEITGNTYGIYVLGSSLDVIKYNHISHNTYGIWFGSTPDSMNISNNDIFDNDYGLATDSTPAAVRDNNIYGNTNLGFGNYSSEVIDAVGNWWGDASGPMHPTLNPGGLGNGVTDRVDFDPWIGEKIDNSISGPPASPTISISADPTSIASGGSATISWTSTDATSCDVNGNSETSGSFSTGSLAETTTYSGTCTGPGGSVSGTVTVTVEEASPPEARLTPDPVIVIPGILGSEQKDGVWIIDPILHTYDNLIETLKDNGYREDYDLFTFPYDWRKSNVETAAVLKQKIDEVKHSCACNKVDLVAHSMGGLIARQYIESDDYNHDVDQLIFLGTPQLGSVDPYLTWEKGEVRPSTTGFVTKFIFEKEAKKQGFSNIFNYVRAKIPSIQQLLPVFDYIKDKDTGLVRTYPQNYPVNSFLGELNQNLDNLLNSGVNIVNIVGRTMQNTTIHYIRVVDPPTPLFWSNGYPEGFLEKIGDRGLEIGEGDGTVPLESSEYIFNNSMVLDSEHSNLPTAAEGEVFRELTGTDPAVLSNEFNFPNLKLLIIKLLSPADMMVIAPDGKKIGKDFITGQEINEISDAFYSGFQSDDEYITILNPLDGNYQVKTQGTGDGGEYTVASGYITDNNIVEKEVVGNIQPGLTQNIDLMVNNNNPEDLSIGFPVSPPSGGGGGSYTGSTTIAPKPETPKSDEPGKILGKIINNIKDSVLVLDSTDNRTVYIIGNNGKKFGFTSEAVFRKLGYSFDNAVRGDLSEYQLGGLIESISAPHPNGSLVFNNGAIWYINNNKRSVFPSMAVFDSYGYNIKQTVPANEFDMNLSEAEIIGLNIN